MLTEKFAWILLKILARKLLPQYQDHRKEIF